MSVQLLFKTTTFIITFCEIAEYMRDLYKQLQF